MQSNEQHEKEYRLAVAFSNMRKTYKELVAASEALPDIDVSEGYPFFLLDFEVIAQAVDQWCAIQTAKILEGLPNRVANPACLSCEFLGIGLDTTGQCAGSAKKACHVFPFIVYSKEQAKAALLSLGYVTKNMTDTDIELAYLKEVQKYESDARKARDARNVQK